jgi:hypothetical protein
LEVNEVSELCGLLVSSNPESWELGLRSSWKLQGADPIPSPAALKVAPLLVVSTLRHRKGDNVGSYHFLMVAS